MKHVEPFLKLEPAVLDYQVPQPPRGWIAHMRDFVEPAVDFVGGWGWALLIVTVACVCFGMSIPGPVGAGIVFIGAVLTRQLLAYWSKSSRW
jgi:hypothetical protein